MIWIHIGQDGNIDAKVSVGNKVRQGNSFQVFVVFPENSIWELDDVKFLAPPNDQFVSVLGTGGQISEATLEFVLGKPSQANAFFIGGTSYTGYLVDVPDTSTIEFVNGGNIALQLIVLDGTQIQNIQSLSLFVEPTFGAKPTLISTSDYEYLVKLLQSVQADILYRGDWASGYTYAVGDLAMYGGKMYICIEPIQQSLIPPSQDQTNWVDLSQNMVGFTAGQGLSDGQEKMRRIAYDESEQQENLKQRCIEMLASEDGDSCIITFYADPYNGNEQKTVLNWEGFYRESEGNNYNNNLPNKDGTLAVENDLKVKTISASSNSELVPNLEAVRDYLSSLSSDEISVLKGVQFTYNSGAIRYVITGWHGLDIANTVLMGTGIVSNAGFVFVAERGSVTDWQVTRYASGVIQTGNADNPNYIMLPSSGGTLATGEKAFTGGEDSSDWSERYVSSKGQKNNCSASLKSDDEEGWFEARFGSESYNKTSSLFFGYIELEDENQTFHYLFPYKNGTFAMLSDVPAVDAHPTLGSDNAVSSNGVAAAIAGVSPSGPTAFTGGSGTGDGVDKLRKVVYDESEQNTALQRRADMGANSTEGYFSAYADDYHNVPQYTTYRYGKITYVWHGSTYNIDIPAKNGTLATTADTTKLYLHTLNATGLPSVCLVTTSSTPITVSQLAGGVPYGISISGVPISMPYGVGTNVFVGVSSRTTDYLTIQYYTGTVLSSANVTSVDDTVTAI